MRESGILALGAVAEGCMDSIAQYLPQLTPWLIQAPAHDPASLVLCPRVSHDRDFRHDLDTISPCAHWLAP